MFIPLHDANHLRHIRLQYVTLGLIAANVLVWLLLGFADPAGDIAAAAVVGLGFIPAVANDFAVLSPELVLVPDRFTYVTYAFLHADFMHLAGNMLFLWVFGDNVEDALGHLRFLVFYILVAIAGAFSHALLYPLSEAPLIGASGAASGIVAAYLMLHPRVRLWVLAFGRFPIPLPAYVALVLWVGFQFLMLATDIDGNVSWAAHAGGIVAGAALVVVMRRRGVPLFDRQIVTPKAVSTDDRPRASVPPIGRRRP
jgi:membrane associated rhomboid family serine protease